MSPVLRSLPLRFLPLASLGKASTHGRLGKAKEWSSSRHCYVEEDVGGDGSSTGGAVAYMYFNNIHAPTFPTALAKLYLNPKRSRAQEGFGDLARPCTGSQRRGDASSGDEDGKASFLALQQTLIVSPYLALLYVSFILDTDIRIKGI
ncbi:hypothetical protein AAFF_G00055200 [Aldrovandia affinis]|uniref:Uncharacterized protein n=1 Tax=Aldrovandia affinis TaxID=143900 RepID=A0AAD7WEF5_9TELE|nr:hypothetical protein AAFF_G00055200 [Aldrovandia affinis]